MWVVITISIIALMLTIAESARVLKKGMAIGFGLVALLGAIHYDYGNDYMNYLQFYEHFITLPFNIDRILSGEYFKEPGWFLINYAFKYLGGFFMMVAVLNIIQNFLIYKFIKKQVNPNWWPFAVFTYLFTTSYYLLSFSMMRQMLVIVIFLSLWPLISKKKWLITSLILLVCSTIHSSALVLIPFSFWGFLPVKNGKIIGIIYAGFLITLWLCGEVMNSIFMSLSDFKSFENYVTNYGDSGFTMKLGIGFLIQLIPFVLSVYFFLRRNFDYSDNQKRLVALAAIHAIITPFGQIIPIVSRIGFYFGAYRIGSFPLIYKNISDKIFRNGLIALNVLITLYDYFTFFTLETWIDKYSTFHTIFSV